MPSLVKVCGVTSVADAQMVAELGADAIGLNFYPRSPRRIDEAMAAQILDVIPSAVTPVALSVDEPWHAALERRRKLSAIKWLQVHGLELTPCPTDDPWVPAFSIKDQESISKIAEFLSRCRDAKSMPVAILVDAHMPGSFGGTGQVAPWHLLSEFDPGVPLILAGGLTPENVADAVRTVRPWMVDVASGIESSPGKKDRGKVERFIDAAHSVR